MAKKKKCSTFEEMLMWTSYRYCIGRHTYVTSLAGEIAQNYYDRLDDDRLEFTANDIRSQIYDKLQWLPFQFNIHRMYNDDPFNPIDVLMEFIDRLGIMSFFHNSTSINSFLIQILSMIPTRINLNGRRRHLQSSHISPSMTLMTFFPGLIWHPALTRRTTRW